MDFDTDLLVQRLINTGILLALAVVAWFVIKRIGRSWVRRMDAKGSDELSTHEAAERHQRFVTLWSVIRVLVAIALVATVVIFTMYIWEIPTAPLLAVGSVIGVGIGFGAQDYVKSVIAGFNIIIEDQYSLGDVVTVAGVSGSVEQVRLRTTVLRDLEGNVHHVPNGDIVVASNLTQGFSAVVVDVGVGYGEDVDHAIEVVEDEARRFAEDPEWDADFLEEPSVLGVNMLGDWSVDIRVVMTVTPDRRWAAKREFLRRIKKRLDAEDIEIPFPYRTIVEKPSRPPDVPAPDAAE